MWGQDEDYVTYKLDPEELTFATKALQSLPVHPDYVPVLIHGINSKFSIYNEQAKGFEFLTPVSFARWLNAKKITKSILLLSSANGKAAQKLADELGKADQLADPKGPKRFVINWEEEVVLYANGHIKGNGKCYRYEWEVSPKLLTGKAIPSGNLYNAQASDFLVTSRNSGPNVLIEWLNEYYKVALTEDEKVLINRLHRPASKLKVDQPVLYYALLARKECFEGWYHLKECDYQDSDLLVNLTFLCQVATISRQYTRNAGQGANMVKFRNAFQLYLKNCKYKTATIEDLSAADLSLTDFEQRVDQSNKAENLQTFFSKLKEQPTTVLEKKWAIIRETEPNLADQLSGTKTSPLPKPLFDLLYQLVDAAPYDVQAEATLTTRKYRSNLTTPINLKIGKGEGLDKGLTFQNLLDITAMNTGTIQQQGSRGSIFETWVREAWAKRNLFDVKQTPAPTNIGKLTFHFASAGVPIAAATTTSYNRIIDCGYIEKNTPKEAEAKKCEIVGVELKHTTGKLSGEPFQQLKDNAALVAEKKLRRIEYLFSTKKAADDNLNVLIGVFPANSKDNNFSIYYIDNNGIKIKI